MSKYKWLQTPLLFTCGLILCRMVYTESLTFFFICWNLFLGLVPLYFAHKLFTTNATGIKAGLLLALWLLFFPNAMYIVTDLFHLKETGDIPMWYDLLLLGSAAITGLTMGFASLRLVERYLARHIPVRLVSWVSLCFFLLSGYGIYLGRYLRWNSWDILMQPTALFADIAYNIVHPFRSIECWTLTLLFGVWMQILYAYFGRQRAPSRPSPGGREVG